MLTSEVLGRLEALGTEQNRKVYARHGVGGPAFGVSYAELGKLRRACGADQALARGLWASGNHDARVLATMVAAPEEATRAELTAWAKEARNHVLSDALAGLVAASPHGRELAAKWQASSDEWTAALGWTVAGRIALSDDELTDAQLEAELATIEERLQASPNRVRHAMNGALIAIGSRNPALGRLATAAARRIGPVRVDHGTTGCKTPDAVSYIAKTAARRKKA